MVLGRIELIYGCMFSGKTDDLIRRLRILDAVRVPYRVFKPVEDTRYSIEGQPPFITTNDQIIRVPAIVVSSSAEIAEYLSKFSPKELPAFAVDEGQFLDEGLIDIAAHEAHANNRRVIISGLISDFKCEPFYLKKSKRTLAELIAHRAYPTELYATCSDTASGKLCLRPAEFTQRFNADGTLAPRESPQVAVGGTQEHAQEKKDDYFYAPRCTEDYVMPK